MDQACEANAGNVAGAAEDAVEVPDRLCSVIMLAIMSLSSVC